MRIFSLSKNVIPASNCDPKTAGTLSVYSLLSVQMTRQAAQYSKTSHQSKKMCIPIRFFLATMLYRTSLTHVLLFQKGCQAPWIPLPFLASKKPRSLCPPSHSHFVRGQLFSGDHCNTKILWGRALLSETFPLVGIRDEKTRGRLAGSMKRSESEFCISLSLFEGHFPLRVRGKRVVGMVAFSFVLPLSPRPAPAPAPRLSVSLSLPLTLSGRFFNHPRYSPSH